MEFKLNLCANLNVFNILRYIKSLKNPNLIQYRNKFSEKRPLVTIKNDICNNVISNLLAFSITEEEIKVLKCFIINTHLMHTCIYCSF